LINYTCLSSGTAKIGHCQINKLLQWRQLLKFEKYCGETKENPIFAVRFEKHL